MSSVRGGPFTRMIEERHFRNLSHFAQAYVEERCAAEPLPSAKAVATMSPHAAEQLKRDKAAALKLLKRIMKKYGRPRKIVTDLSSALNLANGKPRLRPLHLVVRETEFCGLTRARVLARDACP